MKKIGFSTDSLQELVEISFRVQSKTVTEQSKIGSTGNGKMENRHNVCTKTGEATVWFLPVFSLNLAIYLHNLACALVGKTVY